MQGGSVPYEAASRSSARSRAASCARPPPARERRRVLEGAGELVLRARLPQQRDGLVEELADAAEVLLAAGRPREQPRPVAGGDAAPVHVAAGDHAVELRGELEPLDADPLDVELLEQREHARPGEPRPARGVARPEPDLEDGGDLAGAPLPPPHAGERLRREPEVERIAARRGVVLERPLGGLASRPELEQLAMGDRREQVRLALEGGEVPLGAEGADAVDEVERARQLPGAAVRARDDEEPGRRRGARRLDERRDVLGEVPEQLLERLDRVARPPLQHEAEREVHVDLGARGSRAGAGRLAGRGEVAPGAVAVAVAEPRRGERPVQHALRGHVAERDRRRDRLLEVGRRDAGHRPQLAQALEHDLEPAPRPSRERLARPPRDERPEERARDGEAPSRRRRPRRLDRPRGPLRRVEERAPRGGRGARHRLVAACRLGELEQPGAFLPSRPSARAAPRKVHRSAGLARFQPTSVSIETGAGAAARASSRIAATFADMFTSRALTAGCES